MSVDSLNPAFQHAGTVSADLSLLVANLPVFEAEDPGKAWVQLDLQVRFAEALSFDPRTRMLTLRLRSSWSTLAKLRWKPAPSGEIRCALSLPPLLCAKTG